jgi:LysM repeat protein
MTSRKKWPFVITLFLILGLLLVACERPLPDDGSGDAPAPVAPVPTDTGLYPGPDESAGEPAQPAPEPDSAGSGYPAPEAEPVQSAEEGEPVAEAYPAAEGDVPEGEAAEGETAEGDVAEGDAAESETAEELAGERTHTVAAGDNLFQIGLLYGVSWVEIAQANGIVNPDSLTVGQLLIIPEVSETEATEDEDSAADESSEAAESAETEESESTTAEETTPAEGEETETIYVVQSGDNLYRISLSFGVNMMDVARANDLANFDDLAVGQELIIPGVDAAETETAPEESTAGEISHEVQDGETVFGIAFKYGIPWTELVEKNSLSSPYTLETGQILLIPASE